MLTSSLKSVVLIVGVVASVGATGCGRMVANIADEVLGEDDEEDGAVGPCEGALREELRTSLALTPSRGRLSGVVVVDERTVAVGDAGEIVTLEADGTWRSRISQMDVDLHGVARVGATEVVAVGDAGTVVRSGNSGAGWTRIETGTAADLAAVVVVSDEVVVAVGDAVLRSTDRGATWTQVATPAPGGTLRAVTATPYLLAVGDEGAAIVSEDLGETWVATDVGTKADLRAVGYAAENELFVGDIDYFVVAGADGTVRLAHGTWHEVDAVAPATMFHALSPGGRWLVGAGGEIRVNVDETAEVVDFTVFTSPTTADLRAIDGGFDWAVAVGDDGAVVTIESVLVGPTGLLCE